MVSINSSNKINKKSSVADLETDVVQKPAKTSGGARRASGYKTQLLEKQKIKKVYGVAEAQFKRFFKLAVKNRTGLTGETLLCLLERRLDNIVYRLKFANTRAQSRQSVVHGHLLVNGKNVYSPSMLLSVGDVVSFKPRILKQESFVKEVIEKRLNIGVKVPEWLELNKNDKFGRVLRMPSREDIPLQVNEHMVVELYSRN